MDEGVDLEATIAGRPAAVLQLQRAVGNRATLRTLDGAGTDGVTPPVRVGAADDQAEHAADELAERALRQMGSRPGSGLWEGRTNHDDVHRSAASSGRAGAFDADPAVARRLTSRLGRGTPLPGGVRQPLERGFGASFADVRIHADSEAGQLADSLGADAFTQGRDIFFGASQFRPDAPEGQTLLAHELAHVVQNRGTLRRKLRGASAAVTELGGQVAHRGRKERMFNKGDDYTRITEMLGAYEKREAKVVAKGKLGKDDKKWMLEKLADITRLIDRWLQQNDALALADQKVRAKRGREVVSAGEAFREAAVNGDVQAMAEAEKKLAGDESERRVGALKLLRPRLAAERQDLMSNNYIARAGFDDSKLSGGSAWNKDDAVGGAQNRLDKVEYQGGQQGFFIADRPNPTSQADGATLSGIEKFNPNQGARSVASSRLATLFGADVITKVEFATHSTATRAKGIPHAAKKARMGVVSDKAEGTEGYQIRLARNQGERSEYEEQRGSNVVVDMDDPELQRSLNVLQMIDYISRQLDRHAGNFYIATDTRGKVTGITGIDLDVSFGARYNDGGNIAPRDHFVGVPELADAAFRAKVLSVTPQEIRACLDGLISKDEVDATIERFTHLCKVLTEMDPQKIVQAGGWGAGTAKEQGMDSSYLGKLQLTTIKFEFLDKAGPLLVPMQGLSFEQPAIMNALTDLVESGALSPGQALGLLSELVTHVVADPEFVTMRRRAQDARDDDDRAREAVLELAAKQKSLLQNGDDDGMLLLEVDMMAADLEKETTAVMAKSADKSYEEAVKTYVKMMSDIAVMLARRQTRAMVAPKRRLTNEKQPAKV